MSSRAREAPPNGPAIEHNTIIRELQRDTRCRVPGSPTARPIRQAESFELRAVSKALVLLAFLLTNSPSLDTWELTPRS
jgi:hypothetical protein